MKITLATVKSFIKTHEGYLFINILSEFDGMTDGMESRNLGFRPVNHEFSSESFSSVQLAGAHFVGSSRDYFTMYEDAQYIGMSVSNCCIHFIIAIQKESLKTNSKTPKTMSQFFKPVPSAPKYSVSKKGEITNATGFPVVPVDGKVRLTTPKGRMTYTVAELVKETWGVDLPVQPAPEETIDTNFPEKVAANEAYSEEEKALQSQPSKEALDAIIENNKKNAPKLPKAPKKAKKESVMTREKAAEIRTRWAAGEKRGALAKEYGVIHQVVYFITVGKIWKEKTPESN